MFRKTFALATITTAAIAIALAAGVSRASASYIIVPPTTVSVQADLVVSALYHDHLVVTNRADPTYPTFSAGPFWVEMWPTAYYPGGCSGTLWGPSWYYVAGLAPGQSAYIYYGFSFYYQDGVVGYVDAGSDVPERNETNNKAELTCSYGY
jgi:hypothetical protein